MSKQFSNVLDECLRAMQAGEATLESCLEAHPAHVEELSPLLQLAAHSHSLLAPEAPSSAFIASTRSRVLKASGGIDWRANGKRRPLKLFSPPIFRPAYALVALLLVVALLGSGLGVVNASADSLPGDSLYGVKRASEKIQLIITLSPEKDALLLYGFAEKRLTELTQLIELGRYEDLDQALTGLDQALTTISELDPDDTSELGSLGDIEVDLDKQITVLLRVFEQVPEQAKASIQKAIERSVDMQAKMKKVKDVGNPGESAPGQLNKDEKGPPPDRGNGRDKDKPEKTEKPD